MGFQKGVPRHPLAGRKPGSPNKATIELREAILQATDHAGDYLAKQDKSLPRKGRVAYLAWLARTQPQAFAPLVGKLMPVAHEIGGSGGGPVQFERIERVIIDAVVEVSESAGLLEGSLVAPETQSEGKKE